MTYISTRPFQQSDYQRLRTLWNEFYPDTICTTTGLMVDDQRRRPEMLRRRMTSLINGTVVGVGVIEHWKEFYHPQEFLMHVLVEQQHQGKGIEAQLYSDLLAAMDTERPITLRALVREDSPAMQAFFLGCGFTMTTIRRFLSLDLKTCNLKPFEETRHQLTQSGFHFHTFFDLKNDPRRNQKLYELYNELIEDIHNPDPSRLSYESYLAEIDDEEMQRMSWVALEDKDYVGQITLRSNDVTSQFYIEVMGVVRPHRRSKVGLGLLLYALDQARATDYTAVTAHTDWHNWGTMTLAKMLGFIYPVSHIHYVKEAVGGFQSTK